MAQQAKFDTIRSLGFAGIGAAYAPIGTQLVYPARLLCITNNTNGDIFISTDGATDMLFIPLASFKLFDLTTNRLSHDDTFVVPALTQFYVKESTNPTAGSVYIEVIYGAPT